MPLILSAGLLVAALIARPLIASRPIRQRLATSALIFAAVLLIRAAIAGLRLSVDLRQTLGPMATMLLLYGTANALVALVVNPWREDRRPNRFPGIVQDAIVLGLTALAALLLFQDQVVTASAAGAIVVGLALQGTLGNLFAGLALQIERPFRVGHWVRVADVDGVVSEITWRATRVRTRSNDYVVVPNNRLAGDAIVNFSEPTAESRIEVDVKAPLDAAPNRVKAIVDQALRDDTGLSFSREPEILIDDFAGSWMAYKVFLWTTEFGGEEEIRDRARTAIHYALARARMDVTYVREQKLLRDDAPSGRGAIPIADAIGRAAIFAGLAGDERLELAGGCALLLFESGRRVVTQGDAADSMFIVTSGGVTVTLEPSGTEVAHIEAGGFFGEMSLLTGSPRSATVRARVDSELVMIPIAAFRRFVLQNPDVVAVIHEAVERRRAELEAHATTGAPPHRPERQAAHLLVQIRRFLGLTDLSPES